MNAQSIRSRLVALALLLSPVLANAGTCSREDIDYYLKRGFTPEQVVKLCGNGSAEPVAPATAAPAGVAPVPVPAPSPSPAPTAQNDELITLKSSIEADDVQLTPEAIIYTRTKDCLPYGSENYDGFRSKACVTTTTTLARKGLRVVRVQEPMFLVRDAEFVVAGDITRQLSGLERHDRFLRQTLIDEYPERPTEINVPFRKEIDLKKLEATFKRLAY